MSARRRTIAIRRASNAPDIELTIAPVSFSLGIVDFQIVCDPEQKPDNFAGFRLILRELAGDCLAQMQQRSVDAARQIRPAIAAFAVP